MTHHRDFIFDHSEAVERRRRVNRPWTAEEKAKKGLIDSAADSSRAMAKARAGLLEPGPQFDTSRLSGPDGEPIPSKMDSFTATMIAEGVEEADEDRQIEAWQFLVDTGLCWRLQGWFGRSAANMIKAGVLQPYPRDTKQ